ncbi:hypothetical protein LPJ61_000047 [Coemansia biformis]|uniref:Ndc10 domain-containing protein n=1 Tax=Coemansia biformis TaxID=1286918 RepID=A0A9W8D0V6_9FUNG|nr:hypothetical protein LPJ61_000047 [Coemansia biformis]
MAIEVPALAKRVSAIKDDMPKQRKRSRTGGSKDLYEGHSQDVMLAKTLIDPDHQCSVTTVKAYVTHVCAWFRYCRTLSDPDYTLVNEEKLSGFLTWATQTPRLPCKTAQPGAGGSMSYQSARRYVEGGILALWRRYRKASEDNPLHALSYLNTKYAIREATASEHPRTQPERHYTALPIAHDQEDALVRALLVSDGDPLASIRAWAFYCLGASTWIPGARRLHLRLDSLTMALRSDARLVEHTTVPFLEFRVSPDPASPTARFAEVSVARHTSPLLCSWYAVALLVFAQWQARPTAMAQASLHDTATWLTQPLFLPSTSDSLVLLPDDTRVQMVMDEISPLLAHAAAPLKAAPDSHIIRRRDKVMAEMLGLSAPQVVRLEKWRVHHRRQGVTRQQTFFDLTLVLAGQNPPPTPTDVPHAFRAPARTRLQVPDHLLAQVFPWIASDACARMPPRPPGAFVSRQRSHSMSAGHSEDVVRAERSASLRLMRELATVLLQDTAALMADPQCASLVEVHPLFQAPLFASRAFRDFSAYTAQALSLQHVDVYAPPAYPMSLPASPQIRPLLPPPLQHSLSHSLPPFSQPAAMLVSGAQTSLPTSALLSQRAALSSDTLMTLQRMELPRPHHPPRPRPPFARARRHTFETIGEEDAAALAQMACVSSDMSMHHPLPHPSTPFAPLLGHALPTSPAIVPHSAPPSQAPAPIMFPQLGEEQHPPHEQEPGPMPPQYLMQIIDYLSTYNQHTPGHHGSSHPMFPVGIPAAPPLLSPGPPPDHGSAMAMAAAMSMACSNPAHLGGVAVQFPRLASEGSESTASPELASSAAGGHLAPFGSLAHQQPLLLAPAAVPIGGGGHGGASLVFFNAAHDFINPAALAGTSTPPSQMTLPKAKLAQDSSPLSSSPTPTPLSHSPGLHPSAPQQHGLPHGSALHFAVAPQKLQFKADSELFMP